MGGDDRALTTMQRLLWTGQALQPDTPLYNMVQTFRIRGELDPDRFRAAWRLVVDAADALRATVHLADDEPVIRYEPAGHAHVELVDLYEAGGDAALDDWVAKQAGRTFDLARSLVDCVLVRLGADDWCWYLNQHHLITDGQALALVFEAMSTAYAALEADDEPELDLSPYADLAEREAASIGSSAWSRASEYWHARIPVDQEPLAFYGRSPDGSSTGRREPFLVGSERSAALRSLATSDAFRALSPDLALHAIWAAICGGLLHRLTGRDRVRLGTPFLGRGTRAARRTVGVAIEIGVVDLDFTTGPTFDAVAEDARSQLLDGMRHARPGIGTAEMNRSFDAVLNLVTARTGPFAGRETTARWAHSGAMDADQPLRTQVTDFDGTGSFEIQLETIDAVFGAREREMLRAHLDMTIDAFLADPERGVGSFELMSGAERQLLVDAYNATDVALPPGTYVDAFLAACSQRPYDLAVIDGGRRVTFGELQALVERFAARLRHMGVESENVVAIRLDRSLEAIVSIIGTLRAGAAFLPLEPSHPDARLAELLLDAEPVVLVGAPSDDAIAPPGCALITPDLDGLPDPDPGIPLPAVDDLAYLIYTSGSTGTPKAVAMSHLGLLKYAWWGIDAYQAGAPRRFALYSSLAFDLTYSSLFVPPLAGGTIVVYPTSPTRPGLEILDVFDDDSCEFVKLTPSHLQLVLEGGATSETMELMIVGGEILPTGVAAVAAARFGPDVTIINQYGPTETVVGCTWHEFDPITDVGAAVPIGPPSANTKIYILDRYDRPCPPGVEGEMVVGGLGVAPGYWRRPELTAEKFGPDPILAGGRVYRSGDVARWTADGELEFLGRKDDQVKVRGARIELGEVEAEARRVAGVGAAAAMVTTSPGSAGNRLVAFVAPDSDGVQLEGAAVRAAMADMLPAAMLPDHVFVLEAIPVNSNGKIDRSALPSPSTVAAADDDEPDRAPRTEAETRLVELWTEIFSTPVTVGSNFFELGGDSINAIRLVARGRDGGLAFTARDVFAAETIESLAQVVEIDAALPPEPAAVGYVPSPEDELAIKAAMAPDGLEVVDAVLPLGPAQAGILFHAVEDPASAVYQQQVTAEMSPVVSLEALRDALDALVARHEALRSIFVWQKVDAPLQVVRALAPTPIDFVEVADSAEASVAEQVHDLVAEHRARRFRLDAEVAFRVTVVSGGERRWLIVDAHHALLDGWSTQILLQELGALIDQIGRGEDPGLPPARSLADVASWRAARGDRDLDYWRSRLEGFDEVTPIPVAEPTDGPIRYGRACRSLGHDSTARLVAFARESRVTVNTVIQAAWAVVLSRHTRRNDVLFGTTVAGRPDELLGAGDIVGMFINTIPSRMTVSGDDSVDALLRQVQHDEVVARGHAQVSLADLQQLTDVPRSTPLFDSLIVFERVPGSGDPDRSGLAATNVDYREQSTFPFAVQVFPGDDVEVRVVFDAARFAEAEVERVIGHLLTVIDGFVERPHRNIGDVAIVSAEERLTLEAAGQAPPLSGSPTPEAIHERFLRRAVEAPDALAVIAGDEQVTYGELDARSRSVAAALRHADVGPGDTVLLEAAHRVDQIASIIGVLRSGAAYLPFDPATPESRLQTVAAQIGAGVVIGRRPVAGRLLIDPDELAPSADLTQVSVDPESRAYAIMTSGSTGVPKVVDVSHRNIWHSTIARDDFYGPGPDRFLLVSSLAFDSSLVGLWWTLSTGGALVLDGGDEAQPSLTSLVDTIDRHQVTDTLALPSLYDALIETARSDRLASLRRVIVAGEAVASDLVRRHAAVLPGVLLYNEYGPTEAAVWSHATQLTPIEARTPVPIGHPVPGTAAIVVDHHGHASPIGVPGELWLGGPNLAAGYAADPDQTADRFGAAPPAASGTGVDRWYRTGDLVRGDHDGRLSFVGRIDRQVKIRGFRVELEEIEAALASVVPSAEVAVVVAAGDQPWLVAHVDTPIDAPAVIADLKQRLPAHMVPANVVSHEALPTTTTGKVDRRALEAFTIDLTSGVGDAQPRTETQRMLVSLWASVLGTDAGMHTDFFDGGGHSLSAMRLMARVERATGVELPLSELFEAPTPAQFAGLLDPAETPNPAMGSSLVPIRPDGDGQPLFYVSPYEISVLELEKIARHLPNERPFYGLQPAGLVPAESPHETLADMAGHYVDLIKAVQPSGPYAVGGHCEGGWVAYEMAGELVNRGDEVSYLGLVEIPPAADQHEAGGGVRHGAARAMYYLRDRRLINALAWQMKLRWERWIIGRLGRAESRRVRRMREAHARAFEAYEFSYGYDGPMHFVQSTEGDALGWIRDWYRELASDASDVHYDVVDSTHARLLMEPESGEVAAAIERRLARP